MPATEEDDFHGCQSLGGTVRRKIDKMWDINFLRVSEAQLPKTVSSSYYAARRGRCAATKSLSVRIFLRWGGEILGRRNQCTSRANGGWGYFQSRRFGCSPTA